MSSEGDPMLDGDTEGEEVVVRGKPAAAPKTLSKMKRPSAVSEAEPEEPAAKKRPAAADPQDC